MGSAPSGVVTFVLTDVVDSTELWEAAPDAMSTALARHDEIIAATIADAGGLLLKAKGEGDSTFSVFVRASDAVSAAHAVQRTLSAEAWPTDAPIRVRVAVHTGEAVERGGDYFGPAVNLAARLRGMASDGGVVVGATTAGIVRSALPPGCSLVQLDPVSLRGIADPVTAWALTGPDLGPVPAVGAGGATVPRSSGAPSQPALASNLALLADAATFVGRDPERVALRTAWQRVRDGHTLFVVVSGEAGIGKSRLVSEFATEVHADGATVLYGACFEDVDEPYGPFAQMLTRDMASAGAAALAADDRYALARLAPAVMRTIPEQPTSAMPVITEQGVVFDAFERWLSVVAAGLPPLVVVEDLHWATASTLDLLRHLVRRADRQSALYVLITRDTAPDVHADLGRWLGDLDRSPAVSRLPVRGLVRSEVAVLLDVGEEDADAAWIDTGGNPLLLTQRTSGDQGTLGALLAGRDELLDDQARAILDLAATIGPEFDADLLAAGTGEGLLSVLDRLDTAVAAGWIVAQPGHPGRFGFVHGLFRAYRYDRLTHRRRIESHAQATTALSVRGHEAHLSERARHACLSVPVTDPRTAVELAQRAARAAEAAYAFDEAAAHYRRGVDAAAALDPPEPHTDLSLAVGLAATLHRQGLPEGLSMLLDAAQRARDAGDSDALARVAVSFASFGASGRFGGPDDAQLAVVEDALEAVGRDPTSRRALLLLALASQTFDTGSEEGEQRLREARSIAIELGDTAVLREVMHTAAVTRSGHPAAVHEREQLGEEMRRLGAQLRDVALTFQGISLQAGVDLVRGNLRAARAGEEEAAELLGDRTLNLFQALVRQRRAGWAFLDGDLAAAEALVMSTIPWVNALGWSPQVFVGPMIVGLRRMQARDDEWLAAGQALRSTGSFAAVGFMVAAGLARLGRAGEARDALADLRRVDFVMPGVYGWGTAMSELAEAAELVGDSDAARHVLDACGEYRGWIAYSGVPDRPFDQTLAQAALALDETELAEDLASAAVSASRERGTPLFLGRELVFLAEARRRRGAAADDVRPLVLEATSLAANHAARVIDVDIARYGLPT